MLVSFLSRPPRRTRLFGWVVSGAAVLVAGTAARASPVLTEPFLDGNVLDVSAVIGTGANAAYLAVDFNDGTDEAFQCDYDGTLDGYSLLKDVEAATTLADVDEPFTFSGVTEHFVYYATDGSHTTNEFPEIYYSPPAPGDTDLSTSSQGVTYEDSQVGLDEIDVTNGTIIAFNGSTSGPPVLPETSLVPEPTSLASGISVAAVGLLRRRRRRVAVV